MAFKLLLFVLASVVLEEVYGHGMMLGPPNRSSLWRFDPSAPVNYDDNQLYCGGRSVQWDILAGKCGVCGDRYDDPHPQENENTGKYGQGKVVAKYTSGSVIETNILLTTNHKGTFEYHLCVLSNPSSYENEDCFKPLTLTDGSTKFKVEAGIKEFKNSVKLPDGLKCERCVLRWHYNTATTWGQCEDGSWAMGCGPQENFRSCSDIAIY